VSEIDLQATLSALRPRLLRFAHLQLRNESVAEDVVQEAMLAAFEGAARFEGAASLSTWVFSILRNKIVDEIRRRSREPVMANEEAERALEESVADLFDEAGHWVDTPAPWGNPEASLEQKRFWAVFEACLEVLAAKPARVFMMREFLGLETDEICKELAISASNCWVLLHRARLGLRECLGRRWFAEA
jgi:RNA polymerase sigma-70 factor (ECF subfamily)